MQAEPGSARHVTPAAEVEIDADLVGALLREQHPDLAALPLTQLDTGWDNSLFRLGEDQLVRLPRRAVAAPLLEREQRWLPVLAPTLPLPISAPLRLGRPGAGYPWAWSVLPYFAGQAADVAAPADSEAEPWAEFLRALHVAAPAEAPANPYRGVPLAVRDSVFESRLAQLGDADALDTAALRAVWSSGMLASTSDRRSWLHGDLHARNLIVESGRVVAVIDWGDLCAGDPATDLASLWMLLPAAASRRRCMARYGGDAALWQRARAWAVLFGVMLLVTGLADHPRHAAMGRSTLQRVLEGP